MALLLIALALIAGLRWPGVLLAGTFFSYQAEALSGNEAVTSAYAVAACAVAMVQTFRGGAGAIPRLNVLDGTFGLFIVLYAASCAYSGDPAAGILSAQQLLLSAGSMYLLGRLTVTPDRFESVVRQMLVAAIVLGVGFSCLMLGAQGRAKAEYVGLAVAGSTSIGLSQPMPLVAVAGIAALFGLADRKRWILAALVGAVTLFGLYVSLLNARRGVFLAFLVGTIAMAIFARRHLQPGRALILLVIGGIGLTSYLPRLLASRDLKDSLDRLLTNFQGSGLVVDASTRGRQYRLDKALDLFTSNPAFGAGLGGYDHATGLGYPHNMVAEIAANFGVVGLLLLGTWMIALCVGAVTLARSNRYAVPLMGLLAATLAHAQMSFGFYMLKPLFLFTGMLAASWALLAAEEQGSRMGRKMPLDALTNRG